MKLLAAWLSNPGEYWLNILGLIVVVAAGVFIVQKIQANRRIKK